LGIENGHKYLCVPPGVTSQSSNRNPGCNTYRCYGLGPEGELGDIGHEEGAAIGKGVLRAGVREGEFKPRDKPVVGHRSKLAARDKNTTLLLTIPFSIKSTLLFNPAPPLIQR